MLMPAESSLRSSCGESTDNSRKFTSKDIDDAEKWGVFDPERWDAFYGWLYENKLTTHDLRTMGYTNDYLS